MVISFSGLDGSGKSSLIAGVKTALEQERQSVTVLHLNEQIGVYAFLQRVRDLVLGTQRPPDAPPRRLDAPRSGPSPTSSSSTRFPRAASSCTAQSR